MCVLLMILGVWPNCDFKAQLGRSIVWILLYTCLYEKVENNESGKTGNRETQNGQEGKNGNISLYLLQNMRCWWKTIKVVIGQNQENTKESLKKGDAQYDNRDNKNWCFCEMYKTKV